ncbi:MAG: hypoxanthine phosphoribosyltransferase [Actinomycetota bacterium]
MREPVTVLAGEDEVRRRVAEIGATIAADHAGRSPILVAVLKGSAVFLADLMRATPLPLSVDFMAISRYGGADESNGRVRILKDLDEDIGGADVIVVEDIVDTGLTLAYLLAVLRSRRPASLEVCTLIDKSVRRIVPVELRYVGFDCPDVFAVGYGLDLAERYRNIPSLLAVHDQAAVEADPSLLESFLSGGRVAGQEAPA